MTSLVKGLSLDERNMRLRGRDSDGHLLFDGIDSYDKFYETDYSRFDLSISASYIRCVERIFLASPFLSELDYHRMLPWLVQTVGLSDLDLTYTVLGTRCSGDAHTSIMNGLINHFNTWLCMSEVPRSSWVSFHEGDDALIASRGIPKDQVIHNLHLMPVLGFQLKLDVYDYVGDTSFCGRMVFENECVIDSHCDLIRTLTKFHTVCADGDAAALLLAKSMSYYHTDRSTPVLGTLCWVLITMLTPLVNPRRLRRAFDNLMSDYWFRQTHSCSLNDDRPFVEPDVAARVNVSRRCGISIDMQHQYESYYKTWLEDGFIPTNIRALPLDSKFRPMMSLHGLV